MDFGTLWRTVLAWTVGILLTIVVIPPGLVVLALDPFKQRLVRPVVNFWGRSIMRLCFIPVRVEGIDYLEGGELRNAVFAANHQSLMDIFLLLGYLPRRVGFLAKKQTLWIPVIGQLMLMLGHIHVDRSNPRRSLKSVRKCIKAVGRDRSIAIFPEGTRTRDGKMLPFKTGSIKIALRTGAPIVPLTICGTFNVMRRGTFLVRPHPVVLRIGEPIETAGLEKGDMRDLVRRLESTIGEAKREIEREYPEAATPPAPPVSG